MTSADLDSAAASTFVDDWVTAVPWWQESWKQHRVEFGRQAARAFLQNFAALAASRAYAGDAPDWVYFVRALEFLENASGSDPLIDELIAKSFLGKLPDLVPIRDVLVPHLGPKLRAEYDRERDRNSPAAPSPTSDFIDLLAAANPATAAVVKEHASDWGHIHPYGLMSDLVRAATEWLESPGGRLSLEETLRTIDDAYGKDYEVDELIATGFVEALPYPEEDGAEMLGMLGPKLRAEYNLERPAYQLPDPRV